MREHFRDKKENTMTKPNEKIIIVQRGNDILRKIAKEVPLEDIKSKGVQNLIEIMKQAITEIEEAIAVAAPQVGKSLRIFVVSGLVLAVHKPLAEKTKEKKEKKDYGYLIFINPKILKKSRKQNVLTEGCLSVTNIYGIIKRSEKIKVEAYDGSGKKFIKSGSGLFAQVIQHEIDHLEGTLFTDKALSLKRHEESKT